MTFIHVDEIFMMFYGREITKNILFDPKIRFLWRNRNESEKILNISVSNISHLNDLHQSGLVEPLLGLCGLTNSSALFGPSLAEPHLYA